MSFDPHKSKRSQEVIFPCKTQKVTHPPAIFNSIPVVCISCQKYLPAYLDEKLNITNHIKKEISKANKDIGIMMKLSNVLPRHSLITIYNSFIRLHLDYGGIIFDQPENESFCKKNESVQYDAALAITGVIEVLPEKRCIKN